MCIQNLAQPGIGWHRNQRFIREVNEAYAPLFGQFVPPWHYEAARLLDDRLDDNLSTPFRNGADTEIGKTATDIFKHATCNSFPDLDEDARVTPAKGDQGRGHDAVRNRHQAGDGELSPQATVERADRL